MSLSHFVAAHCTMKGRHFMLFRPGIGETRWLGFETNIWNLEPFESKPKSISILDSCLSQYRNQYQYFSPSWLEIKTNSDTYHTWYQLGINVTRNTIFCFYSLLISHSGCNPLPFNLSRVKIERKINYFGFQDILQYEKKGNCTHGSFMPCLVPAMVSN